MTAYLSGYLSANQNCAAGSRILFDQLVENSGDLSMDPATGVVTGFVVGKKYLLRAEVALVGRNTDYAWLDWHWWDSHIAGSVGPCMRTVNNHAGGAGTGNSATQIVTAAIFAATSASHGVSLRCNHDTTSSTDTARGNYTKFAIVELPADCEYAVAQRSVDVSAGATPWVVPYDNTDFGLTAGIALSAGTFTLQANKTYVLEADNSWRSTSSLHADCQWYDATAGVYIGCRSRSFNGNYASNRQGQAPVARAVFRPSVTTDVQLHNIFRNTSATLEGNTGNSADPSVGGPRSYAMIYTLPDGAEYLDAGLTTSTTFDESAEAPVPLDTQNEANQLALVGTQVQTLSAGKLYLLEGKLVALPDGAVNINTGPFRWYNVTAGDWLTPTRGDAVGTMATGTGKQCHGDLMVLFAPAVDTVVELRAEAFTYSAAKAGLDTAVGAGITSIQVYEVASLQQTTCDAPTITAVSPADGTALADSADDARDAAISFDVAHVESVKEVLLSVKHAWDREPRVAYDGATFLGVFAPSAVQTVAGVMSFELRRVGGWSGAIEELRVSAYGNCGGGLYAGDGVGPVISNLSPADGAALGASPAAARNASVSFDIADADGFAGIVIWLRHPWETEPHVIYDDSGFRGRYATRSEVTQNGGDPNDLHFVIRPEGGWPGAVAQFGVNGYDLFGAKEGVDL